MILIKLLANRRWQFITIPLFAILCSLVAASLVILLVGKNPITAFHSLLQGAGLLPKASYAAHKSVLTDFASMLGAYTPMLFAALAVAVANKTGLFNIGVSGQMLCAGFVATALVGYSSLPAWLARPLVLVVGVAAGALVGGLIGLLKHRFNINEVVSSIMLNYIIQYVVSYFIYAHYVDPVSRQSAYIADSARLSLVNAQVGGLKMDLPLCFLLAVAAAVLMHFVLDKTRLGFELKAVGANPKAARYAGIGVGRGMVLAMTISGALAGLAGVTYYLGYYASIGPRTLSDVGFDAIAVAMLGNAHPLGILLSSLLITAISKGSTYMSSTVGVQQEIASVITGLILLFSACGAYLRHLVARLEDTSRVKSEAASAKGGEG